MKSIVIATLFSPTPGARFRDDGPFSGQEFRERFLEVEFQDPKNMEEIEIILDGTAGYSTSFLEEAFGGLARKFGSALCLTRLKFVSEEEPLLIDEITGYIRDAK